MQRRFHACLKWKIASLLMKLHDKHMMETHQETALMPTRPKLIVQDVLLSCQKLS